MTDSSSNYFYPCIRCQQFKNFADINLCRAIRKTGITENSTERLTFRYSLNHRFRHIFIKASHQITVIIVVNRTSFDNF